MAFFSTRWTRSKAQISRLRRRLFRQTLLENFERPASKRNLRFENLESRNLMAAWISQGPAPGINGQVDVPPDDQINGAIQAIVVNPTNANEMYVGSVNGGIWKTTNATNATPHWVPLTDNLRSLSIGALEYDPTDNTRQTLIAGTGFTSSFFLGDELRGVLYSKNGGTSWTELGLTSLANENLTSVAARGATMLAASDNVWGGGNGSGLFRSTDTGLNWSLISGTNGLPVGDVSDIVADPLNTSTFYAAVTGAGGGVFRSTDTGLNWTNITNGIGIVGATTNKIELGVHDNAGTVVVYAAVVNSSTLAGVFRSLNGAVFTALDIPAGGGQGFVHLSIVAHPTDPNLVFVGGAAGTQYLSRINASAALGSQITAINNGTFNSPHVDTREMVIDAVGNLILGSDGGLYKLPTPTTNAGSWSAIVGDMSVFEFHSIAYDNVSNVIAGGAQDNGTLYQLTPNSNVWDHPGFGDGGDVAIDDKSLAGIGQSIRYRSSQNLGGWTREVYDSSNNLVGFPIALARINDPQFVTPVEINNVNPTRILVGGSANLYESFNQGTILINLGAPGANGSVGTPMVYGGFQNGVPNADLIYTGSGSRVFKRTTAGGPITATTALPVGAGTVLDVTVDSDNWNTVFAIDNDQVFMSTNAGTSWRNITGNLASISQVDFHTLEFVPGAAGGSILIGTNSGVFFSSIASIGVWKELGQSLPDVIVYDLEYDPADDVLVAGTMGRGAWLLPDAALEIAANTIAPEPPRLLSIAPNSGQILDANVGNAATSNVLVESPRELVFRFSGSQQLDPASLKGIRITRSGGDDIFGNVNDVLVTPTFLGFGDSERIVIARFGESLPDDRYRIEALAVPDNGLPAVKSINNVILVPRFTGTDRDTYYLNLELGAKILAVVPQPVTRQADGTLKQDRDKVEIYFNDDNLNNALANDPSFYKLILTKDSATPNDDTVFTPTTVAYDATLDKAVLTFGGNLDVLAGGSGTYRLRIGSNRAVATFAAPQAPIVTTIVADVGDTLSSASTLIGTLVGPTSRLIDSTVSVTVTNQLNLSYPGGNLDPGHRDIRDESHLLGGADTDPNITTISYNFADGRAYGTGSNTQPLYSSITPDQKQRIREIFEFYSAQAGIDVVETDASGFTIVVGDLFPLNNPPAPFTPAGIAGGGLAIMNGGLSWNNGLGEDFFDVAFHEIGHLLGLGHTYDQPSGTVQGSTGQLDSGNPIEFFFPGDIDVEHLQFMHRPDNRDVDIYQFNLPVGQKGKIVAETIAERLANSSNLDTYLTLFKRDATGLHIIAINDNYFSDDSLIRADVTGEAGADYFIAVTARGNENYDPKVNGSGSGGVSQGRYQLRMDFRPSEVNQILDTSGTALDGDGDGIAGGEFNFWFKAASPVGIAAVGAPKTIFVDKDSIAFAANGSLSSPYTSIPAAMAAAVPGDIVRLIGSAGLDKNLATTFDNVAYEIGDGGPGKGTLDEGQDLVVPKGVTLMIEAGAILKLASTQIMVGSSDSSTDQSGAAIQVLGTPTQNVIFTSYFDESFGVDTNLLNTTPAKGQWGGIEIRNDVDRDQGRHEPEMDGIFLNYIAQADIRYGGGIVGQGSLGHVVNPIHLTSARPTLLSNRISQSSDAGISADPNSFEETLFTESRFQFAGLFTPDYSRIGPDIRSQLISESSTNGLFIRIDTLPGQKLKTLSVAARLDDTDLVYVLGENLIIEGTPGGALQDSTRPDVSLVSLTRSVGGSLTASATYNYQITNFDREGNEGLPSSVALTATLAGANRTITLSNLPSVDSGFVGRRLYRKLAASATWDLIAELDKDSTSYVDRGTGRLLATGVTLSIATAIQRARRDASLVVDPGVVIKSAGSRIEVGISAQLIAEGTSSKPIVFTSRKDDRYGAGTTFDTNNDLAVGVPLAGDWSGIFARHFSNTSIDSALLAFGGGQSSIPGGFASFNAIEVTQATARIANSIIENNAAGNANAGLSNRDFRGPTDASVIHVVASQPIIFNNTIRNNDTAAVISIDANSMKASPLRDYGRSTGLNSRTDDNVGNLGPFIVGNELGGNAINGMRIRGATLTTETAWDDTDIVHVLQSQIVVPDFHTFGGLLLQSKVDESLVVKLSGATAGFTVSGRPLDIPSRIGGSLQIIGAPGFPVVLTSVADDTVGAGFDWEGRAMLDTNNNGISTGNAGDWRSIRLNPFSNDRNLDTTFELESDPVGDKNRNDLPSTAQKIGTLANNFNGGDENVRLGFTIHGTVASPSDLDVYQFTATAGTVVWFDLDRTGAALDSVIELMDSTGQIIAQSDSSYNESLTGSVYSNPALLAPNGKALPMNQSTFVSATNDFQSINPLDAGLRIQLPGTTGSTKTYNLRVRSSNLSPTDPASKLQDLSQVSNGLSVGPYRLQIRLQQADEVAGSTIRYADIRYATTGIEVLGLPGHSPLTSENSEDPASTTDPATAQLLGNIANTDRSGVSVAGTLSSATDLDWYRFRVSRDSIQAPGGLPLGTVIDVDYADGLGRPDATLWVYRLVGNTPQLVLIGTDSNIADDRSAPAVTSVESDLTRGSFGPRDPFIGVQSLPDGDYLIGITPASRVETQFRQFSQAAAVNPLLRLEPISSVQRISEDHFEGSNFPVFPPLAPPPVVAKQVSFAGNANAVPFNLADVTLFVSQTDQRAAGRSRLLYANPLTGVREAELGQGLNFPLVYDIAVSPAGLVVGAEVESAAAIAAPRNDANIGFITTLQHDGSGQVRSNSGIQTFEAYASAAVPPVFSVTQAQNVLGSAATPGVGMIYTALSFVDDTSLAAANSLALFAIGQRGDRQPFTRSNLGGNPIALTGLTPGDETTAYKNILYRIDPTSRQAVSPTGVPDRTGDRRARGTGTEVREFGVFAQVGLYNVDVNNNAFGDNIVVTTQANGDIVGLAAVGNTLYGVTNAGELWSMQMNGAGGSFTAGFRRGATRISTTMPIGLTGLSTGPRNVEGGIFANMLFGTSATGQIFAFDTTGVLQPIFPGGATSMVAPTAADGLGTVNGIDFGALDVNLWHVSNVRGNEAGHGRPANFDLTKGGNQAGGNSLYFGFEPAGGNATAGNWNRIYSNAATTNTYGFAGGALGAVESNPIDLRGYSVDDKPMLYFTYLADTENSNGPNTDNAPMLDAFRVYGVTADGTSILIATNNAADDGNYTNLNNEVEADVAGNLDAFGNPYKPQVLFDSLEAGDTGGWRQARIPLAALAGLNDVKLRFEFSTGGTFDSADMLRGGQELNVQAGSERNDGDAFSIWGNSFVVDPQFPLGVAKIRDFEFDLGLVLNLPSGASIRSGDQLIVQGQTFTFVTTATGAPREIVFTATSSAVQIAQIVRTSLLAAGYSVAVNTTSPNILNVSSGASIVTAAGIHNVIGLDPQIIIGRPGVSGAVNVVLNIPDGLVLPNNSTITVQGRLFTFRQIPIGAPGEIVYTTVDTAAVIANRVVTALNSVYGGFTASINPVAPSAIVVKSGTRTITLAGPHTVGGGLSVNALAVNSVVPVIATQAMTAPQVRDVLRGAFASTFNDPGQLNNLNVWKFYNNTLQMYGFGVYTPGALPWTAQRPGDTFGPNSNLGDPTRFAQASLRASNNNNQGIFVDDITIGLAERGEMVVGATAAAPVYQNDGLLTDGGFVSPSPIPSGTYQIEIRTAADYLSDATGTLARTFDSNDRLTQQLALVVSSSAFLSDGVVFTLSDGINQLNFEFDVVTSPTDRAVGVTSGNVQLLLPPNASTGAIAQVIRDAINSKPVQKIFRLTASLTGDMSDGAGGYITPDQSNTIHLHGSAAANLNGSLLTNIVGLNLVQFGLDTAFGEDVGDSNRRRDQGQVVISSNTVRNSSTFGIVVDDAVRDQTALAALTGARPYPGSVRNLITTNTSNLAPGVVVANNIVASNTSGGIQISGDNTANVSRAASNIARVYNNTIFGSLNGDRGIVVDQTATATVLNNVLVRLSTGVALAGSGGTTVLGGNLFQSNTTNITGGGTGTFPIQLTATDPLFVNVTNNRFYLAPLSQAIDSSLASLPELGLLSQVKNSVLLPASPLIAPDRDVIGVLRVDDANVQTPSGQGQNVNIDRGAVERADNVRMKAILVNPLDNDSAIVDIDRNSTYVQLLNGSLEYFSILLSDDQGTGPDATTVLAESIIVTENGNRLIEGIDYVFGYNAGSNTIRLTPFAGLWRRDSVYEITLINKPTYRIDSKNGVYINDGEFFQVTLADGTARTFEFESGFVLDVPATLTPASAASQTITYQPISGSVITFELNLVGTSFNPLNTPISISLVDTYLTIADKIATALGAIVPVGAFPVRHLGQGRIHVGGATGDQLLLSNRFLKLSGQPGVSGGAIAFPFVPSSSTTELDIAAKTIQMLNQLGQGVKAYSAGGGVVLVEGVLGLTGTSASALTAIRDIAGNAIDANRSNSLTQFTIVMPDVKFDFGDAPGVGAQTLLVNNGARHAQLPPDARQIHLGLLVDSEANGQPNATATGDDGIVAALDDEDGVTIGGLPFDRYFNISIPDTNVIINASGTGFVDAWIDWNRDGDFIDLGEQVIANQVVTTGNTTFAIRTPATASIGISFMRTRLSTLGNLLSGGVGIGGEVEDRQIEIIRDFRPVAVDDTYSVVEDNTLVIAAPGILAFDTDADLGTTLSVVDSDPAVTGIQPSVLPLFGSLVLNANGSFTYTPNANFAGTDKFVYFVSDSVLNSLLPATVTINVTPVNDAPLFIIPPTVNVLEDSGILADASGQQVQVPISIPFFASGVKAGPVGADDEATQILDFTVVARHPSFFTVQPTIVVDPLNPTFATLTFTLAKNQNRNFVNGLDNFVDVTLVDRGPSAPPNVNTSVTKSFSINIAPVNDPPVPDGYSNSVNEGSTTSFTALSVLEFDLPGPASALDEAAPNQIVSIVAIATLSASGGIVLPFFAGLNLNTFNYTPAPDFVGIDTITYTISDNASPNPLTSKGTITIDVKPVNDPPLFTIPTSIDVVEDQGSVTGLGGQQIQVPISIASFATGIRPGPITAIDEVGQTVTFNLVAQEPSFFVGPLSLDVNPNNKTEAILTFTLAPHRNRDFPNGLSNLIQVIAHDGVSPDVSSSTPVTFAINITQVNDPPIPGTFVRTIAEDIPTDFQASDVLLVAKPGPVEALDELLTQLLSITQVAPQSARGGVVTPVLNGNIVTGFRYTPPSNYYGTDTITYTVTDNGVGPLSTVGTMTITVDPVNDPPEFAVGPNVTVLEDAAAYSRQWVPLNNSIPPTPIISVGPSNELNLVPLATVTFEVTADNPALFSQVPRISPTGVLSFTAAKDANGTAIISVVALEVGGDIAPVVVRSTAAFFTIILSSVNDEPIFTSGGNVTVNEDVGFSQSWATGIQPAAGLASVPQTAIDEAGQSISFVFLSNSNPGLFSTGPAIAFDGKLSFTPAANLNGNAIVTVVARDSGSSTSPNDYESEVKTFTITVTPVNDAPVAIDDNYTTTEDAPLISTTNDVSDNDLELDGDAYTVISLGTVSTRGGSVLLRTDGSFEYDPRSVVALQNMSIGQFLTDTFTYRLQDSTGMFSNIATVTITVEGRNDIPIVVNDEFSVEPNKTTNLVVLRNAIDPDSPLDFASMRIGTPAFNGTVVILSSGQVAYTPNSGFFGNDSFTYRIRDNTGLLSNDATVVVRVNRTPMALADSATALANSSIMINVLANDVYSDDNSSVGSGEVSIVTAPTNGNATVESNGSIHFAPSTGFKGTSTLSYTVRDSNNAVSSPAFVTIQVVPSFYQNALNRFDVNQDGFVSPVDALVIINDIQRRGMRFLSQTEFVPPPYIDVDGSGSVEAIDVLQIINYLSRQTRGLSGEGEASRLVVGATPVVNATSAKQDDVVQVTSVQAIATEAARIDQGVPSTSVEVANRSSRDSIVRSQVSSSGIRKRAQQTDLAFADSADEFWDA